MSIRHGFRVLFFGTDAFACISLAKLFKAYKGQAISHIHVVTKSPKLSGRGLRTLLQGKYRCQ